MNGGGVVPVTFEMALDDIFNAFTPQIWPGKCTGIQKHFPDIVCKDGAIPPPKMKELVTPHPETLQMKQRKGVIHSGNPLWHAIVIGIFCLECELQIGPVDCRGERIRPSQAAIRAEAGERRASVTNEPQ